jgi:hypothetical protein
LNERAGGRIGNEGATLPTRENSPAVLTVPLHDTLGRGLLRALVREAGLTVDEFADLLP